MRPIVKGANIPPYTDKTTLTFGGANAAVFDRILGTHTAIPIGTCLDLWLLYVKGLPPPHGTVADLKKAKSAISNQIGDIYKLASVPLSQRIGPFCSFCETALPGLLEVEHCVPKANYPTFSVNWDNFVLACNPCNTAKGNTPSRGTVEGWMGHPVSPTELQYYNEIRQQHYVWPDLNVDAYRWMPIVLQYFDGTNWQNLPLQVAVNYANQVLSIDYATRTLTARLYIPNTQPQQHVDARVQALITTAGPSPGTVTEMIKLCKLNEPGNGVSTYDRRMLNRTGAWFSCLSTINLYAQAPDPQSRAAIFLLMEMLAVAKGFYSVWVSILNSYTVAAQFVADTNKSGYFPGTNATNIP